MAQQLAPESRRAYVEHDRPSAHTVTDTMGLVTVFPSYAARSHWFTPPLAPLCRSVWWLFLLHFSHLSESTEQSWAL